MCLSRVRQETSGRTGAIARSPGGGSISQGAIATAYCADQQTEAAEYALARRRRPMAIPPNGLVNLASTQALGMLQRGDDLVLGQARAVVAIDRERDPAAAVDVTRPAERIVERSKLLEQEVILFQRRNLLGTRRADVNPIAHGALPLCVGTQKGAGLAAELPRALQVCSAEFSRSYGRFH